MRSFLMARPARHPSRRAGVIAFALTLGVALSGAADDGSKGSLLHEFVAPDPAEDVSFAATTIDGQLPAAIDTPSGIATAPDPTRPPDAQNLYGGNTTDDSPDSSLDPDRDTRQPNVENYEDPFTPTTTPFKRLFAYNAIDTNYTLSVKPLSLTASTPGGEAGPNDESFFADFSVELLPNQPVRVPTVGPSARALKIVTNPETPVTLLRDGADNWFLRATERKRVRVVMEIAIPREVFGSEFANVGWSDLAGVSFESPPSEHRAAAEQVFAKIGVNNTSMSPRDAVNKMVAYFRAFEPSDSPPREHGDIYKDLALSQKGVCRHRAFAFLVTALYLGVPTRLIRNEAHAWVEVSDSKIWHRIDLGGAALNLDNQVDPQKPQHVPPEDPFSWPEKSQDNSGTGLAQRERDAQLGSNGPGNGGNNPGQNNGSSTPPAQTSTPVNPNLPPSKVALDSVEKSIRRGTSLKLKGRVEGDGPCRNVRIDVRLKSADHPTGIVVGSLSTDDDGVYDGSVTIPRDLSTGDYQLLLSTPGDKRCGGGSLD
jgi:hypothetical protein